MNQNFFIRTSLHFYGASAALEPQIYVENVAKNISLFSGRLELFSKKNQHDKDWKHLSKELSVYLHGLLN